MISPKELVDPLTRALKFEAAKQSSRGWAQVRRPKDSSEECAIDEEAVKKHYQRGIIRQKTILMMEQWKNGTGTAQL